MFDQIVVVTNTEHDVLAVGVFLNEAAAEEARLHPPVIGKFLTYAGVLSRDACREAEIREIRFGWLFVARESATPMASVSIRQLQRNQPWSDTYTDDFKADNRAHCHFEHALVHISKALGKLYAMVDELDHHGKATPDEIGRVSDWIADIVICAIRAANMFPGRGSPFDLDTAVLRRVIEKNPGTADSLLRSVQPHDAQLAMKDREIAALKSELARFRAGVAEAAAGLRDLEKLLT